MPFPAKGVLLSTAPRSCSSTIAYVVWNRFCWLLSAISLCEISESHSILTGLSQSQSLPENWGTRGKFDEESHEENSEEEVQGNGIYAWDYTTHTNRSTWKCIPTKEAHYSLNKQIPILSINETNIPIFHTSKPRGNLCVELCRESIQPIDDVAHQCMMPWAKQAVARPEASKQTKCFLVRLRKERKRHDSFIFY